MAQRNGNGTLNVQTHKDGAGPVNRVAAMPEAPPINSVSNGTDGPPPPAVKRDGQGRFAPGGPGGPGCKANRRMAELRQQAVAFLAVPGRLDKVLESLWNRIVYFGDVTAARVLLAYGLGKPPKGMDADEADAAAWQSLASRPSFEDMALTATKTPYESAAEWLQELAAVVGEKRDELLLAAATVAGAAKANAKR